MERINLIKKVLKISVIILGGLVIALLAAFIVHVSRVRAFNETVRSVTGSSTTTEAVVDIYPRGQITDSWEKVNTGMGYSLNAKIYEFTVTNNSGTVMNSWSLTMRPKEDCFINNGWCGTFEIHQFDENGNEKSQDIDLRNFKITDITVDYVLAGQDLLIPLKKGDFVVYHPDGSGVSGEVPIKSGTDFSGMAVCGFILYSKSGMVEMSDYELNYSLNKTLWSGKEGRFYQVAFPLWAMLLLILGIIFFMSVQFEERYFKLTKMIDDAVSISARLSDSKDFYSKQHSERVAKYSRIIAEKLGLDKSDCDKVYYAAIFHNIGNYFVPEQILRKNGKLTRDEYETVKSHTRKGADLIRDIRNIPYAFEAAMYHHERYDGTGYPEGRKGEDIPLIARIIAVADAYDAMNSDRPYRFKLMKEQIREEFIKNRGSQFDPVIVSEFLEIMGELDL